MEGLSTSVLVTQVVLTKEILHGVISPIGRVCLPRGPIRNFAGTLHGYHMLTLLYYSINSELKLVTEIYWWIFGNVT